jgi:hypothetical protein
MREDEVALFLDYYELNGKKLKWKEDYIRGEHLFSMLDTSLHTNHKQSEESVQVEPMVGSETVPLDKGLSPEELEPESEEEEEIVVQKRSREDAKKLRDQRATKRNKT